MYVNSIIITTIENSFKICEHIYIIKLLKDFILYI